MVNSALTKPPVTKFGPAPPLRAELRAMSGSGKAGCGYTTTIRPRLHAHRPAEVTPTTRA